MNYTHQVAVIAYLLFQDKFLFLKRNNLPKIWAPPGGRLKENENPESGLLREIREECGLHAKILQPVNTWFGPWEGGYLLSIDYLAVTDTVKVQLSSEHSAFKWLTLEELNSGNPIKLDDPEGFQVQDFQKAFQIFQTLKRNHI